MAQVDFSSMYDTWHSASLPMITMTRTSIHTMEIQTYTSSARNWNRKKKKQTNRVCIVPTDRQNRREPIKGVEVEVEVGRRGKTSVDLEDPEDPGKTRRRPMVVDEEGEEVRVLQHRGRSKDEDRLGRRGSASHRVNQPCRVNDSMRAEAVVAVLRPETSQVVDHEILMVDALDAVALLGVVDWCSTQGKPAQTLACADGVAAREVQHEGVRYWEGVRQGA